MPVTTVKARVSEMSKRKKLMLLSLPIMAVIVMASIGSQSPTMRTIDLSIPESQLVNKLLSESIESADMPDYEYQIRTGDNLSSIFEQLGFGYSDLMKIMETDLNYLALDTIKPGNTLRFWRDENTNTLSKMELEFSLVERAVYTRNSDDDYSFTDVKNSWCMERVRYGGRDQR